MWQLHPRARGIGASQGKQRIPESPWLGDPRGSRAERRPAEMLWAVVARPAPCPANLRRPRRARAVPESPGTPSEAGTVVSVPRFLPGPPRSPPVLPPRRRTRRHATRTSQERAFRQGARARRDTRWRFAAVPACGAMAEEEDPAAAAAGSGSESEEGVSGDERTRRALRAAPTTVFGASGALLAGVGAAEDGVAWPGMSGPAGRCRGDSGSTWVRALGPPPRPHCAGLGL